LLFVATLKRAENSATQSRRQARQKDVYLFLRSFAPSRLCASHLFSDL
jgi:hypothetical protein